MSTLDYSTTAYPKNMSYHLDRIVNYSKQPIKMWCDRTGTINHQETIRFKLPPNSLVDLDSLLWSYDFTTVKKDAANDDTPRFFPRNSSSIIDAIYIYVNGNLVDSVNNYNHLNNLITDATCGADYFNTGVRDLEASDPSIKVVYNNVNGTVDNYVTMAAAQATEITDTNRRFVVRNWLGFLGTASTRVIDTSFLGDVVIEIRLAEPSICFVGSTNAGAVPSSYTINGSKTYMSITRIAFGDSVYYDLLRDIVRNTGLMIGYKTYTSHRGDRFTKAAGTFTHSFNVNANHLTKLIGTLIMGIYQTESTLVNHSAAIPWKDQLPLVTTEEAFNQSIYFVKEGTGIKDVQWDINGVSQYPQPLEISDIFNQNLIALNQDSDITSGCHPGLRSLSDFQRFYFMNILSFEHIQNTNDFVLEGLDGKASAITCKWSLNYEGAGIAGSVIPLVFSEKQNVMTIGVGQNIQVI